MCAVALRIGASCFVRYPFWNRVPSPFGTRDHQEFSGKAVARIKTISQIAELARLEKVRLEKLAAAASAAGEAGQKLRASAAAATTPAAKKAIRKGGDLVVEVFGDDARGEKTAAKDISIPYIMWGNSQKPQLAGVATLLLTLLRAGSPGTIVNLVDGLPRCLLQLPHRCVAPCIRV